ncbi:acyl carrier protein phosphodiesterase [Cognataquiflexum aquatile]|uniref:acyl carrier protein phosphodiesterase n=1 Tax=Cognataquiflexum aquatile TaxID=2249427 RepID=UPI000DEBF121|nr:ACP phosphodiesterase [Cognataquiflexum aquatile]
MNFLAHAYLSFGDPKVLVGNFIGDFVRGDIDNMYDKDIVVGIKLHWSIDKFTDSHPVVKEAQAILRPEYGRYSMVITDMYFDYFLGRYWKNYHHIPLDQFAEEVYNTIDEYGDSLPEKFLQTFGYMKYYNWLAGYGELDGIRRAMTGMAKRAKFNSKMETAHVFLDQHHEYLKVHFGDFFEDIVSHSKKTLKELRNP